jgi:outer membrane protein TolC
MLGAERQGGIGTSDVLAAQRTLFEVRNEYVTALAAAHVLSAELDRLTATVVPAIEGDRP